MLIKNFKSFAQAFSQRVKNLAYEKFQQLGRPQLYLPSSEQSKEALVQAMVAKEQIKEGAILLLSCVEPCLTFHVRGDRQTKRSRLVMEPGKCTHLYHYYEHPQIGLMHVRVQSWFPFTVSICLNGRNWLAQQMDQAGIDYQQCENCFLKLSDPVAAQVLMNQQLQSDWPKVLRQLLREAHPLADEIVAPLAQRFPRLPAYPGRP